MLVSDAHAYYCAGDTRCALTTAIGTTPAIAVNEYTEGGIAIPAGSAITSLTYYVSIRDTAERDPSVRGGSAAADNTPTFQLLADLTDTLTAYPVTAGRSYPIPKDVFSFGAMKIVAGGGAGGVEISLK